MAYQYAFDAAKLLDQCLTELDEVEQASRAYRIRRGFSSSSVHDLKASLSTTSDLLHRHFQQLLEYERAGGDGALSSSIQVPSWGGIPSSSLSSCVDHLKTVLDVKQREREEQGQQNITKEKQQHPYYPIRNATDSLLFRLIVSLQLCLVRIDDGHWVLAGRRRKSAAASTDYAHSQLAFGGWPLVLTGSLGISTLLVIQSSNHGRLPFNRFTTMTDVSLVSAVTKAGIAAMTASFLRVAWRYGWMSTKIYKSTKSINEWNRQWRLVQSTTSSVTDLRAINTAGPDRKTIEKQSQKLIEDAVRRPPKSFLLQSQGELRFLMLKRAMDVFYASVGTAMVVAKGRSEPDWQLSLVTAAAASFYSLMGAGAGKRAAEVTSSSASACQLIQNSWGMASSATVKNISLHASRLIKGAAVADLIEINGVSCFVLSADPAPELTVAIETFKRRYKRNSIPTLSTIDEQEEHEPAVTRTSVSKPFACSKSFLRQRDVIFHLTGGGFFAHIIASDLPYLLDWSSSTGAVIICPEYGLLPQHTFPVALDQCCAVYRSLLQEGFAVSTLGFEVSRIVVTGESAGGNLAAALCVRLSQDLEKNGKTIQDCDNKMNGQNGESTTSVSSVGMPDALMLSCPVLDMSLDLTPSRVLGTNDPVLPSGLISAISDAYVPPRLGISKKHPLASPIYASDTALSRFPPTLLIASSNDPLLDDSVAFNQRLRGLGVESRLRAAVNMPHAYLGLGTAGFPEAVQVQQELQRWLAFQFTRLREGESFDSSTTALTE